MQNESANQPVKKPIWKSWAEKADTDEARRWADDEFPDREGLLDLDRRDFIKLAGAGMALAGAAGCRQIINADPKAVPYVRAPEGMVPGIAVAYATALSIGGYATGVVVESHEGRPTKIEGNPLHPASLGSTDVFAQADILNLYDPERSQSVIERGEVSSWESFLAAIRPVLKAQAAKGGSGIRVVSEAVVSPTYAAMAARFASKFPNAKWVQYEPVGRANVFAGTATAFGRPLQPIYDFSNADVIVALDADFLTGMPGSVAYARAFADRRRVRRGKAAMSRLYAVESTYTLVGAAADHRIAVKPSEVEAVARALRSRVSGVAASAPSSIDAKWFDALVADLSAAKGRAVVVPGDQADRAVHALAHAINTEIGAVGSTVRYVEPIETDRTDGIAGLGKVAADLAAGSVDLLVVLGGNPVYNAPADLNFAAALEKAKLVVRLGLYEDETSVLSHWHLPEAHALESWGDARAFDGTVSIVQPLTAPLYRGKSAIEVVSELLDQPKGGLEIVRSRYKVSDASWRKILAEGIVPDTAAKTVRVELDKDAVDGLPVGKAASGIEIAFRPDPTVWDGRFANNAWLQELPKPVTTLVWDNAAIVSPSLAKKLGVVPEVGESDAVNIAQYTGRRVLEVSVGGAKVSLPAWILPGQPEDTITLTLGGGRTHGGEVAVGRGFDTYLVRTSRAMHRAEGASAQVTGEEYRLVFTQPHHRMKAEYAESTNRDIVRVATLAEYRSKDGAIFEEVHHGLQRANASETHEGHSNHGAAAAGLGESRPADPSGVWRYTDDSAANKEGWPSLYPEFSNRNYNQWAMSIDLTTCIGCNACTIACQAENNIPVVGKDQVARGREMHWIRMDHYYEGDDFDRPVSHFMPVPCMQCEKAPCEPVCPVAATIHSHEGLNQMVYNRCIGTRYCSNNCPYKVRRFNFLKWTEGSKVGSGLLDYYNKPQLKMLANPDVSVRGRGVMEKCTYCVQRINHVRIEAKKEGREIQDGEIVTACQQVCPTQAIVFGDINNPASEVSRLKAQPHDYGLLSDLNTRPRTTYLAKVRNTHPDLEIA